VHVQEHSSVRTDRALVVGRPRAVRRAHLDEPRARTREHLGDPEAVADLDELAARDDHVAAFRERREREEHRRRVVVDDERRLRAGQPPEQAAEVVLARAAGAGLQVELEVRVAGADLRDAIERGRRQGRPAEVRVHEHAGRVQHAPQARRPRGGELGERTLDEIARIAPGAHVVTGDLDGRPHGRSRERVGLACEPLVAQQQVHGGQVAESRWHVRSVRAAFVLLESGTTLLQ
jgi:hypothetical protein